MILKAFYRSMLVVTGLVVAACQPAPTAEANVTPPDETAAAAPSDSPAAASGAGPGDGSAVAQAAVATDRYPALGIFFGLLTEPERARFGALAEAELCPCEGAVASLDACLQAEDVCMLALSAADLMMRMIKESASDLEIADGLRQSLENARRVHTFNLEDTPYKGAENPVLTIVEFADFQCPHCRHVAGVMSQLMETFGDRVRVYYKHFPLGSHPQAMQAAIASRAAHRQGAFWAYHDTVFANQQQLGTVEDATAMLVGWAVELGLNEERFRADLADPALAAAVAAEREEGMQAGLQGTPTLYVNGVMLMENYEVESLTEYLNRRLAE